MNDAANGQDDSKAPDRGVSEAAGRSAARPSLACALRQSFDPVFKQIAKYQVRLRRWSGLGGLAGGVGLMAGGLEPIGLSLILVGTAVLLVELERAAQGRQDHRRK